VAAAVVAIGAQGLAAPGVRAPDPIALADRVSPLSWLGMFFAWDAPRLPLVDGRLVPWLVAGALTLALAVGPTASDRARMGARYVLLAGLCVVAVVLGWGTFSVWSRLGVGWPHAVLVAYVCGAIVLWLVMRWIDAYGVGQGALVLLLAQTVVGGAGDLASARISSEPVFSVLDVVLVGLPSIALCGALAFRAPAAWPVRIAGGLALTSPLDALGLQVAGFALLSPTLLAAVPGLPEWLHVPLRLSASAAGFVLVWGALGRAPLVRARAHGWLALAVSVLAAELAWPVLAASWLGPVPGSEPTGRARVALGSTDVVLVAHGGNANRDAAVVASRLERLALHADVLDTASRRVHLAIDYAPDLRAVLDVVTARGALALRPVARDQAPLDGLSALASRPLSGVTVRRAGAHFLVSADARDALEELARAFTPPVGTELRFQCEPPRAAGQALSCTAMLVEAALLGSGDVLSARSSSSIDDAGVILELTVRGAARVRGLAASGAARRLAVLLDDDVIAILVAEHAAAAGTTLPVTLGSPREDPDVVRRADALAATLSTAPLSGRWTVQSLRTSVGDPL